MQNLVTPDWPVVLNAENLPVWPVRVFDGDGVECTHVLELNRSTGECRRCRLNESGLMVLDESKTKIVEETVILKTPVTIIRHEQEV